MMENNNFVVLKNIKKIYPNNYEAVHDFNLEIKKNSFVVLVGPSGCGKSTTLRMIAGLEEISGGELYINNRLANYLDPKDREISMVFQNYALYPQLSVYDNIAYGLKVKKVDKAEIQKRVFEAAKILGLGPYLDRYPRELSGGQMQRVALGRAIVKQSPLFLMDEPLSNLDAKLRTQMRTEIVKIHTQSNATTVYVTHDQVEAMTMADLIVIMNKGYVQQIGSPDVIYSNPANIFVATFIGTPCMNMAKGTLDHNSIIVENMEPFTLGDKTYSLIEDFYRDKCEKFTYYSEIVQSELLFDSIEVLSAFKKGKTFKKEALNALNLLVEKEPSNTVDKEIVSRLKGIRDNLEKETLKEDVSDTITYLSSLKETIEEVLKKISSSKSYLKAEKMELLPKGKKDNAFKTIIKSIKNLSRKKEKQAGFFLEKEEINKRYNYYKNSTQRQIRLGVRPEKISDVSGDVLLSRGPLTSVELLGNELNLHFFIGEDRFIAKIPTNYLYKVGEEVNLYANINDLYLFDEISGENILYRKEES